MFSQVVDAAVLIFHRAANATVALLATTAASAFTIVPLLFDHIGPRGCLLVGGWTYPLYSGALLCYNRVSRFLCIEFRTLS